MATQTNGNKGGAAQMRKFPEIILDTTLAELLADDRQDTALDINESLCNIKLCADPRHKSVPLNKKYLITSTNTNDSDDLAHLQLENVSYLLSFWAGSIDVALMACEGWTEDDTLTSDTIEENARTAFAVLNEKQRPRPRIFSNKEHFLQHYKTNKSPIRWGFAADFAEDIPHFIHPELHYRLNSKRWLAECSLRSANDRIIDPACSCPTHTTHPDGLWYFGHDCPTCKTAIDTEITRLKSQLETTSPPFVLKLTQSLGSVGTMLVKGAHDRDETITQILQIQRDTLPHLNRANAHIHPASLVLSNFLPGTTNALNFFVRRDGSIKFLGACHQLATRTTGGGRQHTALTWNEQEALEQKFAVTLSEIGKVLRDEGYSGPCGADIMETDNGTQYVIDLNVRTSTSMILGCLKGHCRERAFGACAVYECLLLSVSREELEERFEREFREGRIILLGNSRLGKKDVWAYPVVLAGEDQDVVKELGGRVLELEVKKGGGVDDEGDDGAQDAGGA